MSHLEEELLGSKFIYDQGFSFNGEKHTISFGKMQGDFPTLRVEKHTREAPLQRWQHDQFSALCVCISAWKSEMALRAVFLMASFLF